ncbi:hypothetical protein CYY_002163 [Polysphondylium violaceum]|uniref:Uncharacterized protein n=1 Tax=Polysphondylium violaceum TaxID=133409 RepID=A0A8J4Q0L0_9MYCE|nr:hypothetical protein CYY_002163 [Polysphondylium violaceum]
MKALNVFLGFILLQACFSFINSQIAHGPGLDLGPIRTDLQNSETQIRNLKRYDYSFCKLYIRDNTTGFEAYTTFHPRVDEFTTLKIPMSNVSIMGNENVVIWMEIPGNKSTTSFYTYNATVDVPKSCTYENGTRLTVTECTDPAVATYNVTEYVMKQGNVTKYGNIVLPPKHVHDLGKNATVNYFTVVVQLANGAITDAVWDGDRINACKDCDQCIDGQCAAKYSDLGCDIGGGCQLKIFMAWAGLDRLKKPCISINKIPSNFAKYSSTSVSKLGLGLLSDFFYRINDNNNNPNRA